MRFSYRKCFLLNQTNPKLQTPINLFKFGKGKTLRGLVNMSTNCSSLLQYFKSITPLLERSLKK